jgi:hypothetical protein
MEIWEGSSSLKYYVTETSWLNGKDVWRHLTAAKWGYVGSLGVAVK